jgi:succinate-acetate transporter protein
MRVITKILLSIAIFCGGSLIVTMIAQSMGSSRGNTHGIGPFILYPVIIAGIWAVWKYNPEKKDDKNNLNKD